MKKFFGKIIDYIKKTAWIQPLLIVCVIFLILFLLQPIANGIGSIVSCIGDTNEMTEISFKEYTKKVEAAAEKGTDEDPIQFVVVFTQDSCSHCKEMKPYINHYIENSGKIKIYNVDVTYDGDEFEDSTIKGDTEKGTLRNLDDRIFDFYTEGNDVGGEPDTSGDGLTLLGTPTFIWYVNGLEVRVDVNPETPSNHASFSEWVKFPKVADYANWSTPFVAKDIIG